MMFTCSPADHRGAGATATGPTATGRAGGARKRFSVDIHCHVHTPAAAEMVKDVWKPETEPTIRFANERTREVNRKQMERIQPQLTSVERRLSDMDAMGIDVQAISPAPFQYHYWADPELGAATARTVNDNLAEIAACHPDRFVAMGTVPMQAPDLAVAELERMVKTLGMRGVEINSNVAGEDLSAERFRKFFAKAEELGVLIFLHPLGFDRADRFVDHYFNNVIGNPLEAALAVGHLIFGGVLDDCPKLKLCVAHGGGYLPSYAGRMDHAHAARPDCRDCIQAAPTSYLKKLYFDTVVFTHHQLEYLVQQYGAEHVIMGSDYPYDMGEENPVGFVEGAPHLGDADKDAILGGNAARLLGIAVPAGS
jgi:aminocarboxymuconate-semialdehyde decarboxylase